MFTCVDRVAKFPKESPKPQVRVQVLSQQGQIMARNIKELPGQTLLSQECL